MPNSRKRKRQKKSNQSGIIIKITVPVLLFIIVILLVNAFRSCSVCDNPSHQPRFTKEGIPDSSLTKTKEDTMAISQPIKLSFYMESSGSMNGFLRGGVPTDFKKDIWEIMNYYSQLTPTVTALSTDVNKQLVGGKYTLSSFQTPFNNGGFVSAVSTNLPDMIRYICKSVDIDSEVAVFISDMQFDPVGQVAPAVLQSVYSTDIAKIFGEFNNAVSLIGAQSNYVYRDGTTIDVAPYYFVLFGKAENVASIRNDISELLSQNGHFIDNIETGFNYKTVPYEYVRDTGCQKLSEMSLMGIENGSCSFDLLLHLENYRWNVCDVDRLKESLIVESENGSSVKIDTIVMDIETKDPDTKSLYRRVTARVKLSVSGMTNSCEIVRWKFDVPATEYTKFAEYYTSVPDNPAQTYSLDSFIKGMFKNGIVSFWNKDYNYIHLTKN